MKKLTAKRSRARVVDKLLSMGLVSERRELYKRRRRRAPGKSSGAGMVLLVPQIVPDLFKFQRLKSNVFCCRQRRSSYLDSHKMTLRTDMKMMRRMMMNLETVRRMKSRSVKIRKTLEKGVRAPMSEWLEEQT